MTERQSVTLSINGNLHEVTADTRSTLLQVLREDLSLTGTKCGCNNGVCGSCTVLVDGEPMRACLVLAVAATEREITTIEGLGNGGELHPVQRAFIEHQGPAMRLLHPRNDHFRKSIAGQEPEPVAGRNTQRTERQPVPLHRLCENRRGRAVIDRRSGGTILISERGRN